MAKTWKKEPMGLKIKWNDDRVQGTTTALLLISRDRLSRGASKNLIAASLADYRNDPKGYKENKSTWPDVGEIGPITNPGHVTYYQNLLAAVAVLLGKFTRGKRQFNSLIELDNYLVFALKNVR